MTIRKAVLGKKITGHNLILRDAQISDAEFILSLRLDPNKNKYLHTVDDDVQAQRDYLAAYEKQYETIYFIIEDRQTGAPVGTVRIYDVQDKSFSWGSWILTDNAPSKAAIESALIIYQFALEHLGLQAAHFEVRLENERVIAFHTRFGATETQRDTIDAFFTIDEISIRNALIKCARFLPDGILIKDL